MSSPRPRLADVAAAAGVSTALVSIVVRGAPGASAATRARVLAIAENLGYRPDQKARVLRQRNSRLLGVSFDIGQAFHGDVVSAMYSVADQLDYGIVLSAVTSERSEARAAESLLDERSEALILLGPRLSSGTLARLAERAPVVAVARRVRATGVDSVRMAEANGARQAVAHLAALGHRDIVHIDGAQAPAAAERRLGYEAAMRKLGLLPAIVSGGVDEDDGTLATRQLLRQRRHPTAVLAFNDACAVGVLDTLLRAGIDVPGEVSVLGFDDSRLARMAHIQLTTVAQPISAIAAAAVAAAIRRVELRTIKFDNDRANFDNDRANIATPDGVARNISLTPTLVVRATTGAATGAART